MCNSNPQTELLTVWGYTYEEIMHRWTIWRKFDPVERIFGGNKSKQNESPTPVINDAAKMAQLQQMFGVKIDTSPKEQKPQ